MKPHFSETEYYIDKFLELKKELDAVRKENARLKELVIKWQDAYSKMEEIRPSLLEERKDG